MLLFAALYGVAEHINVVTDFTVVVDKNGKEKANPQGAGKTMLRNDWLRYIRDYGAPESKAGGWIRPNPVKPVGGGRGGAFTDADITSYRFALVESDVLPLEAQLALWTHLPLPVAAIIASGGSSYHAWVKVDCGGDTDYRQQVSWMLATLNCFGVDLSNRNPSRLARLPGAKRRIGAVGDGAQRLVYLNPEPTGERIFPKAKMS
jgi:hypothetical protein